MCEGDINGSERDSTAYKTDNARQTNELCAENGSIFAFMPNLPPSGNEAVLQENMKIGEKIKELVEEGKIELKVDKNFNMSAVEK